MALFKCSQNTDPIQNQFWELPDHYWIGPMLIDKHTMKPVAGYDVPAVRSMFGVPSTSYAECNLYAQAYSVATMSGQCGVLCYAGMPIRNIDQTNDPNKQPKAYYQDPDDPDCIYVQRLNEVPGEPGLLTKYNTKTHSVVWDVTLGGNQCYRYMVFGSTSEALLLLCQMNYVSGVFVSHNINGYYGAHLYTWTIVRVRKDTGDSMSGTLLLNLPGIPEPKNQYAIYSLGDCHDCQYLGQTPDGLDIFLFSYYGSDVLYNASSGPLGTQRIGYILYDRKMHKLEPLANPLITPSKWYTTSQFPYTYTSDPSQSFGGIVAVKPSNPDPDIQDKVVCYGHWGRLHNLIAYVAQPNMKDVREVWKYTLDPQTKTQSFEALTVLNKDGAQMEYKDWTKPTTDNQAIYTKFYVIKGDDGKKFLMIHEGAGYYNKAKMQSYCLDRNYRTYLFEFQDESTLKLVDTMQLACTGIFWVKPNVFIAGYANKIRIYSIDKKTGKFSMIKSMIPLHPNGAFAYLHIDDVKNIWATEVSWSKNSAQIFAVYLHYFNSYTVNKMTITPEKLQYTRDKTDIETWVDLTVVSDLGDLIATDVNVTILGPAKFKEAGTKSVKTKTKTDQATRLNVILTGAGEVTITMSLAS